MAVNKEQFKSWIEIGLNFLKDTLREFVLQREDCAYERGLEQGRKNAIAALYEANVSDGQIFLLANKYWNIGLEDAEKYLLLEKRAVAREAIKKHLESQGNSSEIQLYYIKLDHHSDLWIYGHQPERLVSELDKIQS